MSILAIIAAINFLTSISTGIFMLLRNPRHAENRGYFYFNATIAVWSLLYVIWQGTKTPEAAFHWIKILTLSICLISCAYLNFIFVFVKILKKKKRELAVYFLLNVIFGFLVMGNILFTRTVPRYGLGFWPVITPIFNIYLVFWIWQFVYGFLLLWQGWKTAYGIRREQIKYFALASFIAVFGGAGNWLLWYDGIYIPPYLNILISVYCLLIGYAVLRYKLLNIKIFAVRSVFALGYTAFLALPFCIGYLSTNWFNATIISVIVAAGGPGIYRALISRTENRILAKQRGQQEILKRMAFQTLSYHDVNRLVRFIVDTCVDKVSIETAYVFLQDHDNKNFAPIAFNRSRYLPEPLCIETSHHLIGMLKGDRGILNLETISLEHNGSSDKIASRAALKEFSNRLGVSLVFPFQSRNLLLGFLALGCKCNRAMYSQDDIETLTLLSYQSALAIANCNYLDEIQGLYKKTVTDPLTGCYNRTFYEEYLKRVVNKAHNTGTSLYFVMLDLDKFKKINDTYGHETGDLILKAFGNLCREGFRKDDIAVRYGGDEFVVTLLNLTQAQCEESIKRFLRELDKIEIETEVDRKKIMLKISASVGIARLKEKETAGQLAKTADSLLYKAKTLGRNCFVFSK